MTSTTREVLDEWHRIIEEGDIAALDAVLADDVVFHSPVVHTPQEGRRTTALYLGAAMRVFEDSGFTYVAETVDDRRIVLEFRCVLDRTQVNGVDLIDVEDGRITRFTVMVRPLQGMQELHRRMGAMLARATDARGG